MQASSPRSAGRIIRLQAMNIARGAAAALCAGRPALIILTFGHTGQHYGRFRTRLPNQRRDGVGAATGWATTGSGVNSGVGGVGSG